MDRDNLERLRAKYGGASAGDVHDPEFKKVVEILFSGADRRAKPYEGVSTFLDAPLIADASQRDDFGGVDIALIGVPITAIYRRVLPFIAIDILRLMLVTAFPVLALVLVRVLN